MMNRPQFISIMELKFRETLTDNHPLLFPETASNDKHSPAQIFVVTCPIVPSASYNDTQNYWDWCHSNLQGSVACYYSDPNSKEEYWGFSGPESDATLWLLKWTK